MDRRKLLGLGLASLSTPAFAQMNDPQEVVTLWPGTPPGGEKLSLPPFRADAHEPPYIRPVDRAVYQVGTPSMVVYRPDKPDGSAIIIAPGGGYSREMFDFEGVDVARRLNQVGMTCFVLRYRLPGEGWQRRSDVPLQDAQRAMRLVRANAARWDIDPARVGFMGFSAGGHLACSIATRFSALVYSAVDDADHAEARPSFSVPMYPVVTMGAGAHQGSRDKLLGTSPTPEQIDAYSCERHIPPNAPPAFLALAADDTVVLPIPNALAYYTALRTASIPAEMHVFEDGGHGFGIARTAGHACAVWPNLFIAWARGHGFVKL
jgi:acetyl esterase/lipase